jgi:hypothetical protein
MDFDRTLHIRNDSTAHRRRAGRSARYAAVVGATVASMLGTFALVSAPASAATNPLTSILTTVTTSVTAPLTLGPATNATAGGCPAGLPAPTNPGAIGDIYPLIPLFGPFSSEAFVWLPLLETLVPVVGPLLPLAEGLLVELQPVLNVLLPIVENLEAEGFAVISPYYAPYRQEVLNAEQQLVELLLPLAQAGASLPGAACLADIEGLIVQSLDQSAAAGTLG